MPTVHTRIVPLRTAGDHVLRWLQGFGGRSAGRPAVSGAAAGSRCSSLQAASRWLPGTSILQRCSFCSAHAAHISWLTA